MKEDHLPIYGPGPFYGAVTLISAVIVLIFANRFFPAGKITTGRIPLFIAAVLLIIFAAHMWLDAVVYTRVDDSILEKKLCTEGIYSWVRNPIYSAIMFVATALVVLSFNRYFYTLPLFYWAFMTVLVAKTEEVWLEREFGEEYLRYKKRVNRCIPWPKSSN